MNGGHRTSRLGECWCGRPINRSVKDSGPMGTTMGIGVCSGCGTITGYCQCDALPGSRKWEQEHRSRRFARGSDDAYGTTA
jgi:hypothetical protein